MGRMRITVIGGNHGTGAELVKVAADAGHLVTCLSRSGCPPQPGVIDVRGDAREAAIVRPAIAEADAVVVTVGGSAGSDRNRTEVTRAAVAAMSAAGVRRLIVQSSLGVGDSTALLPAPVRLFVRAVLGRALADHADQEAVVESSGLAWTIVRPGGLTDGPATGRYLAQETREARPMAGRISRADLAACLLRLLEDESAVGKALAVGTPPR